LFGCISRRTAQNNQALSLHLPTTCQKTTTKNSLLRTSCGALRNPGTQKQCRPEQDVHQQGHVRPSVSSEQVHRCCQQQEAVYKAIRSPPRPAAAFGCAQPTVGARQIQRATGHRTHNRAHVVKLGAIQHRRHVRQPETKRYAYSPEQCDTSPVVHVLFFC
jgi:hypothetical protein